VSLLIAGCICFDTIETPTGRIDRVLGGSAVYASLAASLLTPPELVAAVGYDFTPEIRDGLAARGVGLRGVQSVPDVPTQFWHGRYHPGLHSRDHIAVNLDILDRMDPVVPPDLREPSHVFLAHMPPHLQLRVLDQLVNPGVVLADTIDHWIVTRRAEVVSLFGRADGVIVNDGEAELLTGERDVFRAARAVRWLGPDLVIIKKGEHGAVVLTNNEFIALPAVPTEGVIDPTGAGDTFAGAMAAAMAIGRPFKECVAAGIVTASLTVEGFGTSRLMAATPAEFETRMARYKDMVDF
jgi:sugar/nucleoside kinase (ribokinase family)